MKAKLELLVAVFAIGVVLLVCGCSEGLDDNGMEKTNNQEQIRCAKTHFITEGNVLALDFLNTTNGWRCTKSNADILSEEFMSAIYECSWRVKEEGCWDCGFELHLILPAEFPFVLRQAMFAVLFYLGVHKNVFYSINGCTYNSVVTIPDGLDLEYKTIKDVVQRFQELYEQNRYVKQISVQLSNVYDDSLESRFIFIEKGASQEMTIGDYFRSLHTNGFFEASNHQSVISRAGEYIFIENISKGIPEVADPNGGVGVSGSKRDSRRDD